jgi:tetratricopeptide (TPR) repeat protein
MIDGPAPGSEAALPWTEQLARGRFDLAAQAYRFSEAQDSLLRDNLEALADAQAASRDKAWRAVLRALERPEARHEALPWEGIDHDVALLHAASGALDAREPDEARAHLARFSGTAFPAEAATLEGTLAVLDGDEARARERFEAAIELDPNHFRAVTNVGNLLLEEGDVDGAIACYERAIRLNDGFANAHHNLGVAYRRKGEIAKSVRSLRKAQREGQRREAEDAKTRLGRGGRRNQGAAGGGSRTMRWIVIVAVALLAYWLLVGRGP